MPSILLIDNGSTRPQSTLTLRGLASALEARIGEPVHPVSLQHANKVPAEALNGQAADTFEPFLRRALSQGQRQFLAVPLFFGPSRALSRFIPDTVAALAEDHGPIQMQVAPELCPLPVGEPRLAAILADQIYSTAQGAGIEANRVLLVDHGSPSPRVNAVRRWLASQLPNYLVDGVKVQEAVMERRPGADYDFNGALLEDALNEIHSSQADTPTQDPVIVSMLFLAPGRHAGPGGDIAQICAAAQKANPGLALHITPLVAEHPGLIEILADRISRAD